MTAISATLTAAIPSPPSPDLVIGPLNLRFYGLAIATGVLVAVSIARRRFAAVDGDPEDITTVALVAVPAGLVGARLYHVITDFGDKYSGGRWWPDAFYVWQGGLGIPGGVLLGAVAAIVACRYMRIDWRTVADAAAPAIPVAQAIGRLGNWFNQELYGRPTDLPWGLRIDQPLGHPPGTTFHPTFLYEGLWNLSLAALIVLAGRRVVLRPGRWFAVYVAGYGLGRLWVEALRSDFATELWGLRVNIWTSLVAIVGGLVWLFWKGSPLDRAATEELRAGGNPRAGAGARAGVPAMAAATAGAVASGSDGGSPGDPSAAGATSDDAGATPASEAGSDGPADADSGGDTDADTDGADERDDGPGRAGAGQE